MRSAALPAQNLLFVITVGLLITASTCHPLVAQTNNSYPMIMHVRPAATRIGETSEHEVSARYNLAGAKQVIVSGTGVTAEIIPNEQEKPEDQTKNDVMASKCRLKFTVTADVTPGVRDFRIITPHGASTMGQIVLTREPLVPESADNDTLATAQPVTLPACLCGAIEKAEDVDHYKFTVEAGAGLTFHGRAQRLLNRLHDMQTRVDPVITLRSNTGSVLASSDNYYAGDPLLFHRFEQAGEYILEVRDVRYQGNVDWSYTIDVHARPFVTQTLPLAITAGIEQTLELVGFNLPPDAKTNLMVPAGAPLGLQSIAPSLGGVPLNEVGIDLVNQPVQLETAASAEATPQLVQVPGVIAGCLRQPAEIDRFAFQANAQDKLTFEVVARRVASGMDPNLRILNDQGALISELDDAVFDRMTSADVIIENWTAPAAGTYWIEVRDLHARGGPEFTYAIEVTRPEPYFLLELDTDKTLLTAGMNSVVYVKALRRNGFTGEIQLQVEGLPAGVTASCGKIAGEVADGCVILQAAADAPAGAANIRFLGTGTWNGPDGTANQKSAVARPFQEYYSPGGGRGHYPVDFHTVSVENPMDIRKIVVSTAEIRLMPGGSQRIDVTVERAPDYKGNVTLDVMLQHLEQPYGNCLPKGVKVDTGASKTLLTAGENTGHITLIAAADAPPIEHQTVAVNAHVSINFVMKHTFCGPPLIVSVAPKP